jgi:hypothetical protein
VSVPLETATRNAHASPCAVPRPGSRSRRPWSELRRESDVPDRRTDLKSSTDDERECETPCLLQHSTERPRAPSRTWYKVRTCVGTAVLLAGLLPAQQP